MPIIPIPAYKFLNSHDVFLYSIWKVLDYKSKNYPQTIICCYILWVIWLHNLIHHNFFEHNHLKLVSSHRTKYYWAVMDNIKCADFTVYYLVRLSIKSKTLVRFVATLYSKTFPHPLILLYFAQKSTMRSTLQRTWMPQS